jgi:hypothetical protein
MTTLHTLPNVAHEGRDVCNFVKVINEPLLPYCALSKRLQARLPGLCAHTRNPGTK